MPTHIFIYSLCAGNHMSSTLTCAQARAHTGFFIHGLIKMIKDRLGKLGSMHSCRQNEQAGGSQVKRDVKMILLNSLAVNL